MPRRPPDLPPEDLTLWETIQATIKPLPSSVRQAHVPKTRVPKKSTPHISAFPRPEPIVKTEAALTWQEDKSYARGDKTRMKQGVLKPTATLDLHGMTVVRAEKAITHFLQQAVRDGHAWVEIITGHGRPSIYAPDTEPDRDKGVLKRLLPEWLNQQTHRGLIKRVLPAPQSRGGAVWICLKSDIKS